MERRTGLWCWTRRGGRRRGSPSLLPKRCGCLFPSSRGCVYHLHSTDASPASRCCNRAARSPRESCWRFFGPSLQGSRPSSGTVGWLLLLVTYRRCDPRQMAEPASHQGATLPSEHPASDQGATLPSEHPASHQGATLPSKHPDFGDVSPATFTGCMPSKAPSNKRGWPSVGSLTGPLYCRRKISIASDQIPSDSDPR